MSVEEITTQWLRRQLGWKVDDGQFVGREVLSHSEFMGRVHVVTCGGRSMVFKGPPNHEDAQMIDGSGLSMREVFVYRMFAGLGRHLPRIAPLCYWTRTDSQGRGVFALEKIRTPPLLASTMAAGLSRREVIAATRSLATLHSLTARRNVASPYRLPPWMLTHKSESLREWIRLGFEDVVGVYARWPDGILEANVQRLKTVDVALVTSNANARSHISAMCHGDAWAGNVLFESAPGRPDDVNALLIDWQFAMWGNPLTDLALVLASSVDPVLRVEVLPEVIEVYHRTLVGRCGIKYSLEECCDDYAQAKTFAAMVAVASIGAYTQGMAAVEVSQFLPRFRLALDCVIEPINVGRSFGEPEGPSLAKSYLC